MLGNAWPRSGVTSACSDALSAQKYRSSTSSGRGRQSAATATIVTASVSWSGRLKRRLKPPSARFATYSATYASRIATASARDARSRRVAEVELERYRLERGRAAVGELDEEEQAEVVPQTGVHRVVVDEVA